MKFKTIANVTLAFILLFSGINIGLKVIDYKQTDNYYKELLSSIQNTNQSDVSKEENIDEYTKQKNIYNMLKNENKDYVFWVSVDNTNIDYPVVQTKDNSTYLKLGFNQKKTNSGTIFMDTLNNFLTDKNIVLYGHNMNNKTMFNNLIKFKNKEFFQQNNKIKISNTHNGKEYIYEVFSVYHSDNNFDYNKVVFNDSYTFENYLEDIQKKSIFKKKIDITPKDKIITLTTCSYEFNGAKTNVHAKLIEIKNLNPNALVTKEDISSDNDNSYSIHNMIEY